MEERDAQALIERLTDICEADPRITALLVFGSHARGEADVFSDLDIGLVTTDADRDAVVAELRDLAARLGRPVFAETFDDPANLHVIYADGRALELIVASEDELRLEGPYRAIFDRTDVVARALPRTPEVPAAAQAREEARQLIIWFWHDVEHVVTALGRGQLWWAYGQLDELRRLCLNLARMSAGVPTEADEAYWKVHESVPAVDLAALEATVVPMQRAPMLRAARDLVAFYRERAQTVASAHELAYPSGLDAVVSGALDRLAATEPAP
jgi:aminoglycoside 6-adenylyltransferase